MSALRRNEALVAGVLVIASAILTVQFLAPSPLVVSFRGTSTTVGRAGRYFTPAGAVVIATAGTAVVGSMTYLLFVDSGQISDDQQQTSGDNRQQTSREDPIAESRSTQEGTAVSTEDLLEARRQEWEERMERLADNERVVYETVLDADGVLPQSEIVDQTDLSKATVSRTLDSLEARDLVERRRRGIGNVVWLR